MKQISVTLYCTVATLILVNISSCKKLTSFDYPESPTSAYNIVLDDGNYSYFKYMIDRAGVADLFKGGTEYTFFVANNSAFLTSGYTFKILQDMPEADIKALAKNHIVSGKIDVKAGGANQDLTPLGTLKIAIQKIGNSFYANGGDIVNPNQLATNGYVDVINTLLVSKPTLTDVISGYDNATTKSRLTFLAAAVARASTGSTNFTSILSGSASYTLFAPNDGAFIDAGYASIASINAAAPDVLGNILKYHLITGKKLTTAFDSVPVTAFNGTPLYFDKVVREKGATATYWYANGITFGNGAPSNLMAENGVIHVISRLLPAPVTTTTLTRINGDANLSMFAALIQRASTADPSFNFASILADPSKSYTVFAVNNTGLQAAGYANIAAINAENSVVLANVLKLHMVPKRINNINIAEGGSVNSILYRTDPVTKVSSPVPLTFALAGGFKVKGQSNQTTVPVITGNVVTTNGLLNIIGTVLTP